jgi:hypothetical protein
VLLTGGIFMRRGAARGMDVCPIIFKYIPLGVEVSRQNTTANLEMERIRLFPNSLLCLTMA